MQFWIRSWAMGKKDQENSNNKEKNKMRGWKIVDTCF